jgi:DNA-binding NtrC family response regulator
MRGHAPGSDSPSAPTGPADDASLRDQLEDVEKRRILEALEQTGGNQTKAAALIGMPRRTFVKRLDAYGIPRPRKGKKPGGDR